MFEYVAKLVCGLQRDPSDMRLTRGAYATTINIHNPNEGEVKFSKKLAFTFPPEEQTPGEVRDIGEHVLGPDEALAVDCMDIRRQLGEFPTPYIEGFVVIQSRESLDVSAVYTSAALDANGRPTTQSGIDVEQIRERQRERRPELADLVAVPDIESGSFCKRQEGNLIVTVRNQGLGPAGASTTEVDFFGHGKVSLPTPPLAPNASVDLPFPIPLGCFDPDCEFRITVDVLHDVAEADEGNNTADDTCLG
jgi:CARDB